MIVEDDLRYLKMSGCTGYVVRHSIVVAQKALDIADSVSISVDRTLIKRGGIHHDIGRCRTQSIDHAVVGADIARELGFDEREVGIIEKHIGAGIPEDEAEMLGLPVKSYIPEAPEEIIVAYADNMARHDTIESFHTSLDYFKRSLGRDHRAIERFIRMHDLVRSWL